MGKLKTKPLLWTPVQLNEAVLASGVEGLVGIEELTDYTLENDQIQLSSGFLKKQGTSFTQENILSKNNKTKRLAPSNLSLKSKLKTKQRDDQLNRKVTKGIKNVKRQIKGPLLATILNKEDSDDDTDTSSQNDEEKSEDETEPEDMCPGDESASKDEDILQQSQWTSLFVPQPVAKALLDKGFKEPTEIQRLAIPPAIKGRRDILGAAETGSGKTLAFGIPIIHGILSNLDKESSAAVNSGEDSAEESDKEDLDNEGTGCVKVVNLGMHKPTPTTVQKLWALILTPTRELAVQIRDHLVAALKYTNIKVVVVVGGMSMDKQKRLLKKQPHIVVATPGRLWELVNQGEPHFQNIEDIRFLAIDETDRMTEVNHFPELRSLLEKINSDPAKQKLRQNFVFSATLTLVHDLPLHVKLKNKKTKKKTSVITSDIKMKKLINLLGITDPKIIDVTKKTGMSELLTESSIVCSLDQKDYYLFYFLQRHPGRTLVFANSISCVRRLASLLTILNLKPLPLHANMIQKQRLKNLERFRDSPDGLLLATDVAARGLDIPNVEHVIHYQVPRTSETYVHRSGRTARANHEGLTLLLIESAEQRQYTRLLRTLNRDKELPSFPIMSSLMDAVKQRVNLARDIDKMQLEYKKVSSKFNWVQKAAEEMDLYLDDDEMPVKVNDRATSVIKKQLAAKQKQLKSLLKQSLRPRGYSYKYPTLNSDVSTSAGAFKPAESAIEVVRSAGLEKGNKRKPASKPFKVKKKKRKTETSIGAE